MMREREVEIFRNGRKAILPLFAPVVINVILQVHGEVYHPDLQGDKKIHEYVSMRNKTYILKREKTI